MIEDTIISARNENVCPYRFHACSVCPDLAGESKEAECLQGINLAHP